MNSNVTKLKIPRKMSKSTKKIALGTGGTVHEIPLGDTEMLTPQQLLAKLSRDPTITEVVVVFAVPGLEEDTEDTKIFSAGMEPGRINWLIDKVKLWLMGISV